jgi:hypothetical protein
MVMFSSLTFSLTATAYTDEPGKEAAFYSPIIRVVPDKGFIMISTSSGILWLKASEAAAPHIAKLPVGGRIDVTVVFQGKPNPPIIKSWKLASGGSKCNIFDGTTCVNAEKKQ